jgi:RND family efflux transporter MFP subunit
MRKRWQNTFLLIIILLLIGCAEPPIKKKENIQLVKVFHVPGPEDVAQRSFPGLVEASEKADLSFLVAGQLIEFPVKEGETVKKGQLIARLDPTDYEIAVGEAKSRNEQTHAQLERTTKLLAKQFASQKEYDAWKTAADVAEAKLKLAQQNVKYTKLFASFSGEIAKKYVENFQNVLAKQQIVRLQNREVIDIKVQIPESLVIRSGRIQNGVFEAEFETAPGARYKVKVKEVSPQANPETQTYSVTFTLPNPKDLNIFPGMTAVIHAKFQFIKGTEEKIFTIPMSAVFSNKTGTSYVWVILPSTHTLKKQEVKVSRLAEKGAVITAGLSPGQDIVAAGAEFVKEGMKVKPFVDSGNST